MTRRIGSVGLASTLSIAAGCTEYARLSSGHVGCAASEIQTSNEVEGGGFGIPTTWTATCRGRVYYCTMTHGTWGNNTTGCTEAKSAPSDDEPPSQPDPVVSTRAEPPRKGAGFELGASSEQAAEVCRKAGGQWAASASEASCSQAPLGVGFDGRVVLTLCNARICAIKVVRDAPDAEAVALKDTFVRLANALQDKYGKPDQARIRVPSMCADRLASCLRAQQAKVMAEWNWPSQHAVSLVLAPRAEGVSLVLEYRSPKPAGGALEGL